MVMSYILIDVNDKMLLLEPKDKNTYRPLLNLDLLLLTKRPTNTELLKAIAEALQKVPK